MKELGLSCQVVFQEKFGAGEPSEEMITDIFAAIKEDSYDRVIAVGGGAIMDIGKLLSLKRTGTVHQLFFKEAEVVPAKKLVAIPTTCGTGSEVTNISVAIVRDENGDTTKLGLVSDLLIPQDVCLIPDMLKTLPYAPFASSAIDALIHAVESSAVAGQGHHDLGALWRQGYGADSGGLPQDRRRGPGCQAGLFG